MIFASLWSSFSALQIIHIKLIHWSKSDDDVEFRSCLLPRFTTRSKSFEFATSHSIIYFLLKLDDLSSSMYVLMFQKLSWVVVYNQCVEMHYIIVKQIVLSFIFRRFLIDFWLLNKRFEFDNFNNEFRSRWHVHIIETFQIMK